MTRPFRRFGAAAALGALTASALMNGLAPAVADTRSNTSNRLPNNLYLGDINGDGSADLLQVSANKLFAFGTDYEGPPILHKYFEQNISRVRHREHLRHDRQLLHARAA